MLALLITDPMTGCPAVLLMTLLKVAVSREVAIESITTTEPPAEVTLGSRCGGGGMAPTPFDGGFFG